ncbi:MAG: hypothetical protein LBK99_03520 [Opitutaceae bacterium]|jgi:hypothetical protein|nr:hypothetical protein [Opitutaceae bacterium]
MPEQQQTSPADFDPVFSKGMPIVGGHAVNLWAMLYSNRGDAELEAFFPFTSKDGDIFVKRRELAVTLANEIGWEFHANPEVRSPMLGKIILNRDGRRFEVDVLRSVTGLTDKDFETVNAIPFEDGKIYALPPPDIMLKAKIANAATHDQATRQDVRHIRILLRCCAHYLADAVENVRKGELSERDAIDFFMSAWRVISSERAKAQAVRFDLDLKSAIPPEKSLGDISGLSRLQAFYRHQIGES